MGNSLKLERVQRLGHYQGIGKTSPYEAGYYYCQRNGWIPVDEAVNGRSGEKRCPHCNRRVRTKPHNRSKAERLREWRRTQ